MNCYKITPFFYTIMERKTAEQYLERQAQKGYILSGLYQKYAQFERQTPKTIYYRMTSLPYTEKEQQEYRKQCRKAGWEFVLQTGAFQIYTSSVKRPFPFAISLEQVRLSIMAGILWTLAKLIMAVIILGFLLFGKTISLFMKNDFYFIYAFMLLLFTAYQFGMLGRFLRWKVIWNQYEEDTEAKKISMVSKTSWLGIAATTVMVLLLGLLWMVFIRSFFIGGYRYKWQRDGIVSIFILLSFLASAIYLSSEDFRQQKNCKLIVALYLIICVASLTGAAYFENAENSSPVIIKEAKQHQVTADDLGGKSKVRYQTEDVSSSFLIPASVTFTGDNWNYVDYTYVKCRSESVAAFYLQRRYQEITKRMGEKDRRTNIHKLKDLAGADEAYAFYHNNIIVRNGKRVIFLSSGIPNITPEQLLKAVEKKI